MGNLIEQLGGYDAAKLEGEEWGFDEFLLRKLLEYRRKHNIFEVGDYFCYESKYLSDDPLDGDAYKKLNQLDSIDFKCGWVDGVMRFGGIIRHATDDEIKAGRRL